MKTAVLILAHTGPAMLTRLCGSLRHPCTEVFVHLDAKADIALYAGARQAGATFIRDRVKVTWGGWSMVQAVLNSMREITESGSGFEYLHLISGQDYPLRSMETVNRELNGAAGKNFIAYMPVDESNRADRDLVNRYRRFHIESRLRPSRIALKLLNRIMFIRRKPPVEPVYKGSSWFTLSRECVEYILDHCEKGPSFSAFFRYTANPDEMFFQNIILHSPLAATAVNGNRRYIKWVEGKPSPEKLGPSDFTDMIGSGAWFARKFDGSGEVLDLLDAHLGTRGAL